MSTSAVERLRRVAAAHRAAGHPLAAEQAYRRALDQVDGATDLAATVRAEYAGLLVELGREADAARVESGVGSWPGMRVHLVDGTYELFRQHFARPSHVTADGREVAATRGVLDTVLSLIAGGATHVGVATDHVIESFRNELWPTYKSSVGMPPELLGQFQLVEDALAAMGITVWAMVDREADDGLASAALTAAADERVEQVVICTPDKDLGQCVRGTRVVQLDRRKGNEVVADEASVRAKYGIGPESIPDWLALVGDSADGFPGVPGFGAKTASAVLGRYGHLEDIPEHGHRWDVPGIRSGMRLAAALAEHRDLAFLFRDLATLRPDPPVLHDLEDLRWTGPDEGFEVFAKAIDAERTVERANTLAAART